MPRRNEEIAAGPPAPVGTIAALPEATQQPENPAGDAGGIGAAVAGPTSFKAAASLGLSLLSFVPAPIMLLCCVPAVVVGVWGLVEIRRSKGRLRGTGLAIAGIAIGVLVPVLVALLVPVVRDVRESAINRQSQFHLKLIALGIEGYHDAYGAFPQQAIYSPDGRPLLSWRVAILGFIEHETLRRQFKLDEPWDSPHNLALLPHMPSIYQMPKRPSEKEEGFFTVYQGFVGKSTFFRASHTEKTRRRDLTDGPGTTLMVVEAATPVPWTKPHDVAYDPDGPLPKLGYLSGGFNAALADGTVTRIDLRSVGERTLRNAITINDGQPLGPDWPRR